MFNSKLNLNNLKVVLTTNNYNFGYRGYLINKNKDIYYSFSFNKLRVITESTVLIQKKQLAVFFSLLQKHARKLGLYILWQITDYSFTQRKRLKNFLRRYYLILGVGKTHKILIKVPNNFNKVRLRYRRRFLMIKALELKSILTFWLFLNSVQGILPYKMRGYFSKKFYFRMLKRLKSGKRRR